MVDSTKSETVRADNFRPDYRIPERFRADLADYSSTGYDRGHLVSSANQIGSDIQNSETFLLSNMSPQVGSFNRGIWKRLESAIRKLDADPDIFETYVLTAPIFDFNKEIETIGDRKNEHGIDIPIPHAFAKSVLTEDKRGLLKLRTFVMNNEKLDGDLADYLAVTYDVEQYVGGRFWDRVAGGDLHEDKCQKGEMW